MTRFLVTGSKGQLGTELLEQLGGTHHELLGVDLDNGAATVDLTDRDQVLGAISEYQPDVVIHGAAFTAVDRCESEPATAYLVNCMATRFVADAVRRIGAHLVYVSTDYVFDGTKSTPYVEWDATNPKSVYGHTKLGGEMEIDPAWSVARTSWVCGRYGNNIVATVLRLAAERDTLSFVDDQVGHPTMAHDLATKLIELAVHRAPGTYHVTNDGAVSWHGFVQAVFEAAGFDPERVLPISTAEFAAARPADAPPMAPRPANSVLDNFALRASGIGALGDFRESLVPVVNHLLAR